MFGYELIPDIQDRIKNFFKNPCIDTWNEIYSIIINTNGITIWQGWIALDETAPKSVKMTDDSMTVYEWERIPNVFTVYRIIKEFKEIK